MHGATNYHLSYNNIFIDMDKYALGDDVNEKNFKKNILPVKTQLLLNIIRNYIIVK